MPHEPHARTKKHTPLSHNMRPGVGDENEPGALQLHEMEEELTLVGRDGQEVVHLEHHLFLSGAFVVLCSAFANGRCKSNHSL